LRVAPSQGQDRPFPSRTKNCPPRCRYNLLSILLEPTLFLRRRLDPFVLPTSPSNRRRGPLPSARRPSLSPCRGNLLKCRWSGVRHTIPMLVRSGRVMRRKEGLGREHGGRLLILIRWLRLRRSCLGILTVRFRLGGEMDKVEVRRDRIGVKGKTGPWTYACKLPSSSTYYYYIHTYIHIYWTCYPRHHI